MSNELGILFLSSIKSVGSILILALVGVALVRKKVIKQSDLVVLSKFIIYATLPALLMTKIASSIKLEQFKTLWILPLSCVVFVFVGVGFGYIIVKLFKPQEKYKKAVLVCSGFQNAGFVPIPLVAAVILNTPIFANNIDAADAQGITYLSAFLMLYSPLLWTLGFRLISSHPDKEKKPFNIKNLITPPVWGMIIGLTISFIPVVRDTFCLPTGKLNSIFKAITILGDGTIPCALIVLGGRLAFGPKSGHVSKRILFSIAFVKLILLPIFAIGYIYFLRAVNIVPVTILLALVLVIEAAMPQATNLIVMCSAENNDIEDGMGTILFWNYLFSIPTITIFIMITLYLFK